MNLPEYITRQQITDAFAAMGLDYTQVKSFSGDRDEPWLLVALADPRPTVEYVALTIPIFDEAPPQDDDLLGELRSEGGAV